MHLLRLCIKKSGDSLSGNLRSLLYNGGKYASVSGIVADSIWAYSDISITLSDVKEKTILDISIYGNVSFNPYLINFEDIKQVLKEKYNLLHIEINNFINILSSNLEIDNIIDIKSIEEQSIKNYISINHPDINDIDITIKEIQDLKNSLIDNKEYDVIINNMIDDGE